LIGAVIFKWSSCSDCLWSYFDP